jgi:predicted RNA-binding Zn-ribbon protein involved in translation (DUF1610 family)
MIGDVFYPVALICVFFSLIILVGIGASYLWLRWLNARMTRCPACGQKGGGELVSSDVVTTKSYIDWKDAAHSKGVRVREQTYADHFRCEHCGHEWETTGQEKKRVPLKQG